MLSINSLSRHSQCKTSFTSCLKWIKLYLCLVMSVLLALQPGHTVTLFGCVKRKWVDSGESVQVLGGAEGVLFSLVILFPSFLSLLLRCRVGSSVSQTTSFAFPRNFIKLHLHWRCQFHWYFIWLQAVENKSKVITPSCINQRSAKNDSERMQHLILLSELLLTGYSVL